ncbi:MAG: hypothetical protein ACRYFZ_07665 [Janthinobacterium lividum]
MSTMRVNRHFLGKLGKILGMLQVFALHAHAQSKDLAQFIATKKGYEQNPYPKVKNITNFTIMYPGIALVPAGGGIFMAGWQKWFLNPARENLTFAVDYCEADASFYLFTTTKTKSVILKLTENEQSPYTKVLEMPLGIYGLKAISPQAFWIWGQQGASWCIWKYDAKALKLVYQSAAVIRDVAPLNERTLAVATDHSIITLSQGDAATEIIKMDAQIDGVAIDTDGTLFVSTEKGILHYLSPELADDAEIVTYGIHGIVRRYQKSLYVLWREANQVVEIKL